MTHDDWQDSLLRRPSKTGPGDLRRVAANAVTILSNDDRWAGVIAFDDFRSTAVTLKPPPWDGVDAPAVPAVGEWTDQDSARCSNWLARSHDLDLPTQIVEQAIAVVAAKTRVHPVRDWLAALKWDGIPRVERLFIDYLGAADTEYSLAVGARWALSAVARVFEPGAKADCLVVLEAPQGVGKSTFARALVPDPSWFFDTPFTMGDKDGYQSLRGKWIIELGELHTLSRSDANRAKNFLSATSDTYRPSFARRALDFPRQCVFIGTTNATEYLRDETGGRRFWPVRCARLDRPRLEKDRAQLWAEARVRYERGEAWHVDSDALAELCAAEQDARFVEDAWEAPALEWLMSPGHPQRRRDGVTSGEVLKGALAIDTERWTKADQDRVAALLRRLGWERGKQERDGNSRIRRFRPKAVTLVTVPVTDLVTGVSPVNQQEFIDMSPVSSAYARPHIHARAGGLIGSRGDSGDTGDAVTAGRGGL